MMFCISSKKILISSTEKLIVSSEKKYFTFFYDEGNMIVSIAGGSAEHSLHTNMIFANVWFLKLLGQMFEFFSTIILKYSW